MAELTKSTKRIREEPEFGDEQYRKDLEKIAKENVKLASIFAEGKPEDVRQSYKEAFLAGTLCVCTPLEQAIGDCFVRQIKWEELDYSESDYSEESSSIEDTMDEDPSSEEA